MKIWRSCNKNKNAHLFKTRCRSARKQSAYGMQVVEVTSQVWYGVIPLQWDVTRSEQSRQTETSLEGLRPRLQPSRPRPEDMATAAKLSSASSPVLRLLWSSRCYDVRHTPMSGCPPLSWSVDRMCQCNTQWLKTWTKHSIVNDFKAGNFSPYFCGVSLSNQSERILFRQECRRYAQK